jgi:hypothetical protein
VHPDYDQVQSCPFASWEPLDITDLSTMFEWCYSTCGQTCTKPCVSTRWEN